MAYLQFGKFGINADAVKDMSKSDFKKAFGKSLGANTEKAYKEISKLNKRKSGTTDTDK